MGALDTITAALAELMPTFAKSDGTIENKIIDVVATYADTEAIERDNTLETIREALANQKVTTKNYYRGKAIEFQLGDVLKYDPINQGGYYDPINVENRIITQAYIIGVYPAFTLLVNKVDSAGVLTTLTTDELNSFKTYFDAFQPMGMDIDINSLPVAQIKDDNISIYVSAGTDAGDVVEKVNSYFLDAQSVLRRNNAVSLTEIVDLIQQYPTVQAVGFANPTATEVQLDGSTVTVSPVNGIFNLTNGAYTFATEITTANIKTMP